MRIAILFLISLHLIACATQTIEQAVLPHQNIKNESTDNIIVPDKISGTYYIDIPDTEEIQFHGQRDSVGVAGENGGMMYPGYGVGSFLVAIATHAAISGSMQKAKRNKAIEKADLVTKPYLNFIQELTPTSILNQSLLLHKESTASNHQLESAQQLPETNSWYTRISPVFIMSSSEDSIIIKNDIEIIQSRYLNDDSQENTAYSRTIYLQSIPLDNKSSWLYSGGEKFKLTLNELLIKSINMALNEFTHDNDNKPELSTIRYLDNGNKKVERGRLLDTTCTHITFESLKGELKSMPQLPQMVKDTCTDDRQTSG